MEVSGVALCGNFTDYDCNLVLNGAGIRVKWWITLYVGSLYL